MSANALVVDLFPSSPRTLERRLAGRALIHWEAARAGRELPSLADYAVAPVPFDEADTFLVRIAPRENEDEIVRCGETALFALGLDPVGRNPLEVLPSATDRGLRFHRTAAELHKPIADVGRFCNRLGHEVLYRCVLLPLSSDQTEVDHVLGVFSFKTAE